MSAILQNYNLAYISAPKCACTSIKELIFRIENNCDFNKARDQKGAIRLHINGKRHYIHNFYPTIAYEEQPLHLLAKLQCFCVVRNPLDRIVSCYWNRVVRYGELNPEKICNLEIDAPANPNLNEFIIHLDQYCKSPRINHHSLPLTHFLGNKPDVYTKIFNLKNISQLPKHLKQYFGRTRKLSHLQARLSEPTATASLNTLSTEATQQIRDRYSDDFDCYGKYF